MAAAKAGVSRRRAYGGKQRRGSPHRRLSGSKFLFSFPRERLATK
jgi:hypothetical protein